MKRILAVLLTIAMMFALCGCGKTEQAKHAEETIAAIGTVTINSLSQIERAEAEVAALTEKEVKSLDNLTVLYDARAAYNELAADILEAKIAAVGELNFNSGSMLAAVRESYDSESREIQALVTNYEVLEKAEKELPAFRASVVSEEISSALAMTVETTEDVDALNTAIEAINMKYEMLDSEEKSLVTDYEKLEVKRTESEAILAQSVLKDVKMWTDQVYSHLELYINFTNPNEKTIKYITWGVMFQNTVGDYMEYWGENIYRCSDTGPYETGKGRSGSGWYWQYYSSKVDIYEVAAVRLGSVEIEYMDGSIVKIENPEALDTVMKK